MQQAKSYSATKLDYHAKRDSIHALNFIRFMFGHNKIFFQFWKCSKISFPLWSLCMYVISDIDKYYPGFPWYEKKFGWINLWHILSHILMVILAELFIQND